MPTMLVTVSVTGKVSQNHSSPARENKYPRGTNSTIVRSTVRAELFSPAPTAWKKTGKIRDVTIGRKLIPINLKPEVPILITSSSCVNTFSIGPGTARKHIVPTDIRISPNKIESVNVFLTLTKSALA